MTDEVQVLDQNAQVSVNCLSVLSLGGYCLVGTWSRLIVLVVVPLQHGDLRSNVEEGLLEGL